MDDQVEVVRQAIIAASSFTDESNWPEKAASVALTTTRDLILEECAKVAEGVATRFGDESEHYERHGMADEEKFADGACTGAVYCYRAIRALINQPVK